MVNLILRLNKKNKKWKELLTVTVEKDTRDMKLYTRCYISKMTMNMRQEIFWIDFSKEDLSYKST